MKVGIISDTHDHAERVGLALQIFRDQGVETIVHCGDMTSGETAKLFRGIPTHAVLGNCDMDEYALAMAVGNTGGQFHGLSGQLLIDDLKIAWTHGHEKRLLQHLQSSGKWDFVFHGHTHARHRELVGRTTVINPGAIQRVGIPTIGILDTKTREYETFEVG